MRRARSRFMPGEEAASALREAAELGRRGIGSVLSILGESVSEEREAIEAAREYLDLLGSIHETGTGAEISLKLTHLGIHLDPSPASSSLKRILERARELKNFVWIDMESSAFTDRTLETYRTLKGVYPNLGLCIQSALYRTMDDLESLIPLGPAIRLVKGAYAEPADLAFPRKSDVDANYLKIAERMLETDALERGMRPAFATHDARLIESIRQEAEGRNLEPSKYEFQMLYGIAVDLQQRLVAEGHRLWVTIAYGRAWFPWYMRRLAERPANLWFVLKTLIPRSRGARRRLS